MGNRPVSKDLLNKIASGTHKDSAHSLKILLLIPPGPDALEVLRPRKIFSTSADVVLICSSFNSSCGQMTGSGSASEPAGRLHCSDKVVSFTSKSGMPLMSFIL